MDIFTLNRTIVNLEAAILNKGYVDAEVTIRLEDPSHRTYNRRLHIGISHNHSTEYRTREDRSFSLLNDTPFSTEEVEGLITEATQYVANLPTVQDAAGAHNIRSIETIIAEMRGLAITSDTKELQAHYAEQADKLEGINNETIKLRYQAGYHITDQS